MGFLLFIAALQASQAEPLRAPPVDQCGGDLTFVEYRDRLTAAVAAKDAIALEPLVSPDVLVSFGGEGGWVEFATKWKLDHPEESELWGELANVLKLGCEETGDSRIAPGNFNQLSDLGEGLPPYFAVQKDAALRSQPDDTAALVMLLDHHVLIEILDDEPETVPEGWLHARLTNGQTGYVRMSAVRNAIDYRAGFEQRDGTWVMTSFVAGD